MKEVEGGSQGRDISRHVRQTTGTRPLEAVCRDYFPDLFDGNVGKDEFISVGIYELPIHGLQVECIGGVE